MIKRLVLNGVMFVLAAVIVYAQPVEEEEQVRGAIESFLQAFENGDLDAMKSAFADDATTFPRAIMSYQPSPDVRVSKYRRVRGLDPQMIELVARRKNREGPPNTSIEPQDLEIKLFNDAALVTFHLGRNNRLSRRTFVLAKRSGAWRIVHLHASNVRGQSD